MIIKKEIKLGKFLNSESFVKIKKIKNEKITLIKKFKKNINDELIDLFIILGNLKKRKKKIKLIIPYFPYSRQDKKKKNYIRPIYLILKILKIFNIRKIITIDIHNKKIKNLKNINVKKIIKKISKKKTIIFPDIGSFKRYGKIGKKIIISKKKRKKNKVKVKIKLKKCKKVIIVDDIIDSAGTLKSIYNKIKKKVNHIYIYCTHLISKKKIIKKILRKNKIKKIYTTDSYYRGNNNKIKVFKIKKIIK